MGCEAPDQKPMLKHRKGLWSPEEDQRLRSYILKHGHGCWSTVPLRAGLQRNGKSCRLRWINYLRPGLKRGLFNQQEEETILTLHHMLGNKWSQIAQHLPGRTDNEMKNFWHSYLKKQVMKAEDTKAKKTQCTSSSSDTIQSSSPPQNPKTLISSYTPSETSTHQSNPLKSVLPKILFAEWLSVDHVHGGNLANSSFHQHGQNFQDGVAHGILLNNIEGTFGGELHNDLSHGANSISSSIQLFKRRSKFQDQISNGLTNYYFSGGDHACGEIHMNNDVMYI